MRNERRAAISAISALLAVALGLGLFAGALGQEGGGVYNRPLAQAPPDQSPLQGISTEDWQVDESFSTHLPLVIISTEERPPISARWNAGGVSVPLEGVEPYRSGTFRLIDTGGKNGLTDTPIHTTDLHLKRRGNSSMFHEKAQYLLKFVTASGQEKPLDLLGMGAESEWVLGGTMADKSMMRNFLAYRLAAQFMPYTPEIQYCEVVYQVDGVYYYDGIYTLIESIQQGPNRIAIAEAKRQTMLSSYIVRRDRFAEDETILNTWATQQNLSEEYLGLTYPGRKNTTPEIVEHVTQDLSRIEKVIYSDDPAVFATYPRYIDVDSFVDYFLFNEYLGCYDAGLHSTYMYKEPGGKLYIGPVWDFDMAMDNYGEEPLDVEVTAFQTRPWFDRLMADQNFLSKLEKRYAQLRRGPLSDGVYQDTVDAVVAHLGPAIEREWLRWGHVYTQETSLSLKNTGANGELVRDSREYRQEIYRLKTSIARHAQAIGPHLRLLERSTVMNTGFSQYDSLLLLLAVLAFAIPSFYASRK